MISSTKVLLSNKCQCKLCLDIIESKHRHDFVECRCGEIFTDGGLDYVRRGAKDLNMIIDMCEERQKTKEELRQSLDYMLEKNIEYKYPMYSLETIKGFEELLTSSD